MAFLYIIAFSRTPLKFLAFWRHLVELGCHCSVGATADTFGYWPLELNILEHQMSRTWPELAILERIWSVVREEGASIQSLTSWFMVDSLLIVLIFDIVLQNRHQNRHQIDQSGAQVR